MSRAYPLPRTEEDPRFSLGLVIDVIRVLEEHGFPKIENSPDIVELQQALFRFIYDRPEVMPS